MKKTALYVSLSLLALILLVYGQVRKFEFVNFDDRDALLANTHIRDGLSVAGMAWAFTSSYAANWFPITWISHMLDFQLSGADAGLHHLTNLMIHAISTLLLFALLRRITGRLWESAFVSFVFALHPQHVESVAWVSERKDVLSAFFWFLTTWLYLDYVEKPDARRYLLALGAFCLGLMSKQMLVTLPFTLLLLDYWPLARQKTKRQLLEKIPFFAVSAGASTIAYQVQQQAGAVLASDTLPIAIRAANAVVTYISYLGQFFWPTGLAVFYPYPASTPNWQVVACAIGLLAITALALLRPYLAVGWFWYLGTLVPVIGLVQIGMQAKADRYTYIPMIGVSIMLAWGVAEIMTRWPKTKSPLQIVGAAVCLVWLAITWTQVPYWRNSVPLFEHAIASTENNFIAHLNLGVVLAEQGRANDALRHLYTAVEEKPEHADAHDTLGALLGQMGRTGDAAEQFQQAIRLQPNDAEAHSNLGNALLAQGKVSEAANEFQAALRIVPDFATARFGLGVALLNLGRTADSIPQLQEALRLDPNLTPARDALNKALSLQK